MIQRIHLQIFLSSLALASAVACGNSSAPQGAGGTRSGSSARSGEQADDDSGPCCQFPVEVVFYTQSAWNLLADPLQADPSPCANYYISIPAPTSDKTFPRAGVAAQMRARGPAFHAMAEFHWASWSQVTSITAYEKGVEFRRRMAAAGYDVDAGDTWAINELPSSVRFSSAVRQDVRDVVRGLYDGPGDLSPSSGAVFIVGLGQGTINLSVYKPNLENWIEDEPFWLDVDGAARWWAQEVYSDPHYVCVGSESLDTRASFINDFTEHVANLAEVSPVARSAASYLERSFVPLMNAVWLSSSGYGNTRIPLDAMQAHVSAQVYATRAFADSYPYPTGRLGFAWARLPDAPDPELSLLAQRLASSIHYAYDRGGGFALGACSPDGDEDGCWCDVDGAYFNPAWQTFYTW